MIGIGIVLLPVILFYGYYYIKAAIIFVFGDYPSSP